MFCMSNELRNGDKRAWDTLAYYFKNGITISGRVLNWLVNEAETECVIEEGYDDFENSSRWTIGKYYILRLDGDAYRVWEQVGLTEMQPNEWFDQVPERVMQKQKTVVDWMTIEEIESYLEAMK